MDFITEIKESKLRQQKANILLEQIIKDYLIDIKNHEIDLEKLKANIHLEILKKIGFITNEEERELLRISTGLLHFKDLKRFLYLR